jgi:DNA-directed RNA polymerase subunit H (RpoH/RPB5)
MIVDIISLLFTCTVIPALSIGFMVYVTIAQFRLERKFDFLREERKIMRSELDSVRDRLKKLEIAKKEAERIEQQDTISGAEKAEEGDSTAEDANQETRLRDQAD